MRQFPFLLSKQQRHCLNWNYRGYSLIFIDNLLIKMAIATESRDLPLTNLN